MNKYRLMINTWIINIKPFQLDPIADMDNIILLCMKKIVATTRPIDMKSETANERFNNTACKWAPPNTATTNQYRFSNFKSSPPPIRNSIFVES